MTAFGKFSLRLALYGLFAAYLVGDLFVFNGPIRQKVDSSRPGSPQAIAAAKANGAVARVFHHPITRNQLDRAVHDRLWLEGKSFQELPAAEQKLVRYAALGDLIDHQLLRMKVKVNTTEVAVTDEEVAARFNDFASRFEAPEALETALKSQGISSKGQLRERLAARLQQEKYVELRIGPLAGVSDEEAQAWYAENHESIAHPERVEARHLFIPTLTTPSEEARAALETALNSLKEKSADFVSLAKQISQDPGTKDRGGSLGWLTRDRVPPDFAAPLFSLPLNEPRLIRTKLGWHLVEVTARKDPEPQSFESAKAEIVASLKSAKRLQAITDFRSALRQFEAKQIEIFHDMMAQ